MRYKLIRGQGLGTFNNKDAQRLREWGKKGWLLKRSYLLLNFYLLEKGEPEDLEYALAFPREISMSGRRKWEKMASPWYSGSLGGCASSRGKVLF